MSIGQYRVRGNPEWLQDNLFTDTSGASPPLAVRLESLDPLHIAYLDIFVDRLPRFSQPAYTLPDGAQIYETLARFDPENHVHFTVSFTFAVGTSGKVPVAVTVNREEVIAAAKEQMALDNPKTDEQ